MSGGYTPIDCGAYSKLEVAILRRWRLRVTWRDEQGQSHLDILMPRDLETRAGAEYLIAESGDHREAERIRLDRIDRWECLDGELG